MNELVFWSANGDSVTTSLLVTEKFGKIHDHVIRDIKELLAKSHSPNLAAQNSAAKFFYESEYDNRGKQYPIYNEPGFSLLVLCYYHWTWQKHMLYA